MVVLLALSGVSYAQTTYATITGTVTDPSGAVVAKATLTATNLATGIASTTTSNAAGAYTIAQLNEGTYRLRAEASGFKEFVVQDVKLVSGAVRRVDVLLQLSAAATTIEVSTGASQIVDRSSTRLRYQERRHPEKYPDECTLALGLLQ